MIESEKLLEARNAVRENTAQINALCNETNLCKQKLEIQLENTKKYKDMNYSFLNELDKKALAVLVNNANALAKLLNQVIE